jgi:putative transcriptional regulator
MYSPVTAAALAEEVGERLKLARLNADLSQAEVAERAGLTRKAVVNAEKGKVQLEVFLAILIALDKADQVDLLMPKQLVSPIQLAKLRGRQRQRASGSRKKPARDAPGW